MRSSKGLILTAVVTGLMLTILWAALPAGASITGTKHDFSGKGWGTDEICVFCHSPHNALQDSGASVKPLWNHTLSSAVYTLYSSYSLKEGSSQTQPNGPSKLCLSCHDGSVAIDSFGGNTGTNFVTGTPQVGAGNSLANDHPISIRFRHFANAGSTSHGGAGYDWDATGPGSRCDNCHTTAHDAGHLNGSVLFYGSVGAMTIECGSCHEPHNKFAANPKFLRKPIDGSVICLVCHNK